jgi:hypothetical protein
MWRLSLILLATSTTTGCPDSRFYSLDAVDVSSDGSIVAVGGVRPGGFDCQTAEQFQTTVYSAGGSRSVLPGGAILSRNGRYAALFSSISPSLSYPTGVESHTVVDLQTGQQITYSGWGVGSVLLGSSSPWVSHRLANDGTLLLNNSSGLVLARGTQTTVLGVLPFSYDGWINEAGTQVIYATSTQLFSYSLATHSSTLLANQSSGFVTASDDGSVVAFGGNRAVPQVFVVRSDGTGLRQLTGFPEGVYPVAMSGDGKVVFATTYASPYRLVRIDVVTGQWSDIIAPTSALFNNGPLGFRPGLLACIGGFGFSQETLQAQQPLGGVEVQVAGSAVPIASVSRSSGVWFQVPWDLPPGYFDVELHTSYSSASQFVAGREALRLQGALFNRRDTSTRQATVDVLTAAHADFSGLISDADPALRARVGAYEPASGAGLGRSVPTAIGPDDFADLPAEYGPGDRFRGPPGLHRSAGRCIFRWASAPDVRGLPGRCNDAHRLPDTGMVLDPPHGPRLRGLPPR